MVFGGRLVTQTAVFFGAEGCGAGLPEPDALLVPFELLSSGPFLRFLFRRSSLASTALAGVWSGVRGLYPTLGGH